MFADTHQSSSVASSLNSAPVAIMQVEEPDISTSCGGGGPTLSPSSQDTRSYSPLPTSLESDTVRTLPSKRKKTEYEDAEIHRQYDTAIDLVRASGQDYIHNEGIF